MSAPTSLGFSQQVNSQKPITALDRAAAPRGDLRAAARRRCEDDRPPHRGGYRRALRRRPCRRSCAAPRRPARRRWPRGSRRRGPQARVPTVASAPSRYHRARFFLAGGEADDLGAGFVRRACTASCRLPPRRDDQRLPPARPARGAAPAPSRIRPWRRKPLPGRRHLVGTRDQRRPSGTAAFSA